MTWNTDHDRGPKTDPWEPVDKSDQEFRRRLAAELGFEVPPAPTPKESWERRARELAYIHANYRPRNTLGSRTVRGLWITTLFGIVCPIVLGMTALIIGGMEGAFIAVLGAGIAMLGVCGVTSFVMISRIFPLLSSGRKRSDDVQGMSHDASHTQGEP